MQVGDQPHLHNPDTWPKRSWSDSIIHERAEQAGRGNGKDPGVEL